MNRVLILEPTKSVRKSLCELLEINGFEVISTEDIESGESIAVAAMGRKIPFDLLIYNVCQAPMQGVLATLPSIALSDNPTIEEALRVSHAGAIDYLCRPFDMNRLVRVVRETMETLAQESTADEGDKTKEQRKARRRVNRCDHKAKEMVGTSPQIEKLRTLIEKIAPSEARVMILGENGTGKELVARCIHEKSQRAAAPFVEVNCAAIPSELIESELFGHEKGAFTSAVKQRRGKFEQADGGTLFLDEIGDMSLAAQAKVLRALQEHKISRVGSDTDIDVNVRVLAATNKDIRAEIAAGNFREDLYHRLSVIVVRVVALRDRAEDIPILVDHFLHAICEEYHINCKEISHEAIDLLTHLAWSGNIRELRNVVERLVVLSEKRIEADDVETYCIY